MKNCPFLTKYNYPFNLDDSFVSDWFKDLCKKWCPIQKYNSICFEDFDLMNQKLKTGKAPCPHCNSIKAWVVEHYTDQRPDGIQCLYCSQIIYWDKPLKRASHGNL